MARGCVKQRYIFLLVYSYWWLACTQILVHRPLYSHILHHGQGLCKQIGTHTVAIKIFWWRAYAQMLFHSPLNSHIGLATII
jgi:hypothetical protein